MTDMVVRLPDGGTWTITTAGIRALMAQGVLVPTGTNGYRVSDADAFGREVARVHLVPTEGRLQ